MINRVRHSRSGMTLVEMLVVLAIIATLASIAIPGFAKLGAFSRNDVSDAARQVLTILKSAQTYATTYNVDAAVIYAVNARDDSRDGSAVPIIDGIAMVRRLRQDEFNVINGRLAASGAPVMIGGSESAGDLPFVPVTTRIGQFNLLPQGAVMYGAPPLAPLDAPGFELVDPAGPVEHKEPIYAGLEPIRVYTLDGELLRPRTVNSVTLAYAPGTANYQQLRFPAHVFRPTAELRTSSARARLEVSLGAAPDAPLNERFLDTTVPTEANRVPYTPVELFQASGRVRVRDTSES